MLHHPLYALQPHRFMRHVVLPLHHAPSGTRRLLYAQCPPPQKPKQLAPSVAEVMIIVGDGSCTLTSTALPGVPAGVSDAPVNVAPYVAFTNDDPPPPPPPNPQAPLQP